MDKKIYILVVLFALITLAYCQGGPVGVPCNSQNEGRHFPTTYNCSSYYTCFQGNFLVQNCPGGFWFSFEQQSCVQPSGDICPQLTTTAQPTTTPILTTPRPQPVNCPPTGISKIPDPFLCRRYFLCYGGVAVERFCSQRLYFSRSQRRCVRREDTDCNLESNVCPPFNDPNNVVFIPNQVDCRHYSICYNGVPHEHDCGPGLHWDPLDNWCIRAEESTCEPSFVLPEIREIDCPGDRVNEHTFVPHPTNCAFYFICFNRQSSLHRCGNRLLYDHTIKNCFFGDRAICFPGSS